MTILPAVAMVLLSSMGEGAPSGEVTVRLAPDRFARRGEAEAPVMVAEFSDFKCHACEKFNLTIMPNLEKEFIDTGRVQVVFVDFPLIDQDHYTTVAESVHCAGAQGRYWEMHDAIWANIGALSDAHLLSYAEGLGLGVSDFSACLQSGRFRTRVLEDLAFTNGLGLSARPTFFIGRRDTSAAAGTWRGIFIKGAQSYVVYRSVIRRMLQQASGKPGPSG